MPFDSPAYIYDAVDNFHDDLMHIIDKAETMDSLQADTAALTAKISHLEGKAMDHEGEREEDPSYPTDYSWWHWYQGAQVLMVALQCTSILRLSGHSETSRMQTMCLMCWI